MDFAMLPPEINSGRMYVGPGSGPMLADAAAWGGLAAELYSTATSYQPVISGLTAGPWLGPSSASMAAAAAHYVAWMSTTAAQAEQTATQAKAAAAAYETAFAMTVPPPLIAANRSLLMPLVATNLFGQNTPAIVATETQYAEMWAQDAAAMYGYAGSSASATTLTPFTPPPPTTKPGGLAGQAAAVGQATGTSAATNTQTVLSLTSAVPTALQGLASPLPSTSAAAGILQSLGLTSPLGYAEGAVSSAGLAVSSGAWSSAADADAAMVASHDEITGTHDQVIGTLGQLSGMEGRIMNRFDQLGAVRTAVSAGVGQATSVGALSVPQAWTAAAPAIRLSAVALPATSLSAAPEVFAGSTGSLFSEMALASMAGRAMGGSVSPGRPERIGAITRTPETTSPEQILAIRFARGESTKRNTATGSPCCMTRVPEEPSALGRRCGGCPPGVQRVPVGGARSGRRICSGSNVDLSRGLGGADTRCRRLRQVPRRCRRRAAYTDGAQHGRIFCSARCGVREAHHRRGRQFANRGTQAHPHALGQP
jgi:PPE-repeat protein